MKCVWCLKCEIKNPEWEQMNGRTKRYEPLCKSCAKRRLNNPYNGLLDLRQIKEPKL